MSKRKKLVHSVSPPDKISLYFPSLKIFRVFLPKDGRTSHLFHKMLDGLWILKGAVGTRGGPYKGEGEHRRHEWMSPRFPRAQARSSFHGVRECIAQHGSGTRREPAREARWVEQPVSFRSISQKICRECHINRFILKKIPLFSQLNRILSEVFLDDG